MKVRLIAIITKDYDIPDDLETLQETYQVTTPDEAMDVDREVFTDTPEFLLEGLGNDTKLEVKVVRRREL